MSEYESNYADCLAGMKTDDVAPTLYVRASAFRRHLRYDCGDSSTVRVITRGWGRRRLQPP